MKLVYTVALTILISFSLIANASSDHISPLQIPGAQTVTVTMAKDLFDKGGIFIDVRSSKDWEAGRIPDAEHMNIKSEFSKEKFELIVKNKNDPVIFYCNGPKCLRSTEAVKQAIDWGYINVYFFREGFPSWKKTQNPIE